MELPADLASRLQPIGNDPPVNSNSAAVAIILTASENEILLVKRTERLGDPWSGQMAFPGGKYQKGDKTLTKTVVREAGEEVGVNLEARLMGRLPEIVPRNQPGITVVPYVSLWYTKPKIVLAEDELENHFWVDLTELRESYAQRQIPLINRQMESYVCSGYIVWGLTARILGMFFELAGF